MDDRTEFNRLFWHSRRGMLEIDVMLMPLLAITTEVCRRPIN